MRDIGPLFFLLLLLFFLVFFLYCLCLTLVTDYGLHRISGGSIPFSSLFWENCIQFISFFPHKFVRMYHGYIEGSEPKVFSVGRFLITKLAFLIEEELVKLVFFSFSEPFTSFKKFTHLI